MFMTSYFNTSFDHCIIDELIMHRLPGKENLLDYMVTIDVLSKFLNLLLQKLGEELDLIRFLYDFDDLLDRSCSMSMSA